MLLRQRLRHRRQRAFAGGHCRGGGIMLGGGGHVRVSPAPGVDASLVAPTTSCAPPGRRRCRLPGSRQLLRQRTCRVSAATAPLPSTTIRWEDDGGVKAEKAVDPAHDSRREELQRLTLDKGLKPLCRDYGLKATGTKVRAGGLLRTESPA